MANDTTLNRAYVLFDRETLINGKRRAWQGWFGSGQHDGTSRSDSVKNPFLIRNSPSALQGLLSGNISIDLAAQYPSEQESGFLWDVFEKRVHPVLRISHAWELKKFQSISNDLEDRKQMTGPQHAFMFSVYHISVLSLSDDECRKGLLRPRSDLLAAFQTLCEEALSRTNLFCITDITVLKTLTIYVVTKTLSEVVFRTC